MQEVVTVSLNGMAYQLEQPGHARLRAYLDEAGRVLTADPDREEILRDLEQAIGEKLARTLGPHKNVVAVSEVEAALAEMGAVQPAGAAGSTSAPAPTGAPRKLYRIHEGEMLGGVCNGLAAYLRLDVALVRIGFVLLAFATSGFWLLVYLLMLLLVPSAETFEQKAAARGLSFDAQQLIERARTKYAEFRGRGASTAPP